MSYGFAGRGVSAADGSFLGAGASVFAGVPNSLFAATMTFRFGFGNSAAISSKESGAIRSISAIHRRHSIKLVFCSREATMRRKYFRTIDFRRSPGETPESMPPTKAAFKNRISPSVSPSEPSNERARSIKSFTRPTQGISFTS